MNDRGSNQIRHEGRTEKHGPRVPVGSAGRDRNIAVGLALANEAHKRARALTGGRQIPTRRPATPEDIERLTGTPEHPDVPFGLEQCERCGGWWGECLSKGVEGEPIVIFVRCVCHKQLECEACGELLFERLPGLPASYYYNEEMRQVVHIPSFAALIGHRCKVGAERSASP